MIYIVIHGLLAPVMKLAYDVKPIAKNISLLQKEGYSIANFGKYHGQFNFSGRLEKHISTVGSENIVQWLAKNPKAKIISYYDNYNPDQKPDFEHQFRGKIIAIWNRDEVLLHPEIAARESHAQQSRGKITD